MENTTIRMPVADNWTVPDNIQRMTFDFSWEPNPNEPAMIHEFGTQHQKTGGPIYTVEGATYPNSLAVYNRALCLPLFAHLAIDDVAKVCDAVISFLEA